MMDKPNEPLERVAFGALQDTGEQPEALKFEGIRIGFAESPRSAEVPNWQDFDGVVLALVFSTGSRHEMLGTAVLVGPSFAVTARHTVEDFVPKLSSGAVSASTYGIAADGLRVYSVTAGMLVDRTDTCILRLHLRTAPPPSRVMRFATLSTRQPAIGETLYTLGFVASAETFEQDEVEVLKMAAKLRLTSGPLLIAYQTPRDSIVAPWPALEVDAPLFGGMSGGPVIDAQGCVVAIGSRSPNLGPGEEPSPMMAALIWPTLAQKFPADSGQLTSLLELNGHYTVITGSDALRVSYRSTGELDAVYTAWT